MIPLLKQSALAAKKGLIAYPEALDSGTWPDNTNVSREYLWILCEFSTFLVFISFLQLFGNIKCC